MADGAVALHAHGVSPDAVTALLVDADRSFVQFAREELNQTSGQPVCLLHASTLEQADAILRETPVAVVLLERHLPDGDSLEWIRNNRTTLQAGILLLSGEGREPSSFGSLGQDLLVKSHLDGDHLADAIRQAAERERTRQELLQNREQFQSLIEHARDLITVVDEAGVVVYQSPATGALLGTAPQAHHGSSFVEIVHPEDAARARLLLEQVFTDDLTPIDEFRLPHADGSMRTFEVVASRMTLGTGERRAVLNGRDITERRSAEDVLRVREAQLRQAQKMEAVGRLAGGIAHDFSNVLTVISGACERLQDDITQGSAKAGQVDVILRHCARATALTRQLLAFSRQQTIAPRIVDLGELVGRASELIAQLIGSNIAVDVDLDPDMRPVEVDPVQMEQVLMNLAINARDAMPDGGTLRVVVRNVTVTSAMAALRPPMMPGDYVRMDVSDTGHGMSPEVQARVFEPFFTTKDPSRGTGLGLATVYGIITQSRGHVWIDSAPGRGTRFEVYLPASQSTPDRDHAAHAGDAATTQAATILVTEDDPDLRSLLIDTLEAKGYTVVEAGGPSEALGVVARHEGAIDLLLTDLIMPGGSGRELARRMSSTQPRLKVLYMSGYGEPSPERGALLEPGDPFLAKPFTRQQLLQSINSLLR
ncbi:MAG: ATP-binding protein [Vicinamibacterales bacterium]